MMMHRPANLLNFNDIKHDECKSKQSHTQMKHFTRSLSQAQNLIHVLISILE